VNVTKLKHYLFLVLGFAFTFGALIPFLIAWSIDTKDLDFWLRLAVIALAPLPFAIISAAFGLFLVQLADDKYPTAPSILWRHFKRSAERASHHLGRTLGFLMMTAFALIILRATGWWTLFDPMKSTSDWPWYNFVGLVLGGCFSGYLVFIGIRQLGDRG